MTRKRIVLVIVLAAIVGFTWWRIAGEGKKEPRKAPVSVEMAQARLGPAPVELTAMGQVSSPLSVAVRPQVSGALAEIYFKEGADVTAGEKLFLIDPAPYKAAVNQARAQLARDRAALASARSQYQRLEPLAKKEYASAQEIDNAREAMLQAQAVVEADQAALAQAQINLDRTLVTAPSAGRAGSMSVHAGNVVGPSDAAPVVVINQLQPIQVDFSIPQSALADVQAALARGPVAARVSGEQAGQILAQGSLVFVDNAVSAATGTVRLKAEVDNRDLHLWPGAFVAVTLTLKVESALLVPELAVQPGAAGSYVFMLDEAGKVVLRNVTVLRQVGREVAIGEGLKAGEAVVARVPRGLNPGVKVGIVGARTDAPQGEKAAAP